MTDQYATHCIQFVAAIVCRNSIALETKVEPEMLIASLRPIYVFIRSEVLAGHAVDMVALRDNQALDQKFVAQVMVEMVSDANWEYYERHVIEAWTCRTITQSCKAIAEMGGGSQERIEAIEKTLTSVTMTKTGDLVKVSELVAPFIGLMQERHKLHGKIPGISTGLRTVDSSTNGIQPGQYWVIGGRPSSGKSALMAQLIRHVAIKENQPVGVITIESSKTELYQRMLIQESRIDANKIQTSYGLTASQFADVQAVSGVFHATDKITIEDSPSATLSGIRSTAHKLKAKDGIKVLFVDYLQLVQIDRRGAEKREVVSEVSSGLKRLARELGIALVALAQLSRDADERRPGLGDFQWSSQIEQDADIGLLIWHKQASTTEEEKSFLVVAKARDGKTGDVPILFKRDILTFYEKDR